MITKSLIMKLFHAKFLVFVLISTSLIISCCKDPVDEPDPPDTGKIVLKFAHFVDGLPLQKDTQKYTNAAGNPYEINEVKYFISELTLHNTDGTSFVINDMKEINYIDIDIASTLTWNVYDAIPAGSYSSISFRFGIESSKNQSFMFVNAPEVNMMWPDFLGGGYHYMMINGKWKNTAMQLSPFNCHLGIGRVISGSDTTYTDNSFIANLPSSAFTVSKDQTKEIQLVMNIESWFSSPNIYNHNTYGGDIMENQAAMHLIAQNGSDVFTVGYIH